MPLCHETVKKETVLMLYLSNFRANPQNCQNVSVAVAAVTFWQVFDCDKLTLLKIGGGYIASFWHGWRHAGGVADGYCPAGHGST